MSCGQTGKTAILFCFVQERVSADPDDPEIKELRQQLELLGALPTRRALSHQQEMELWNWAESEVAAGRVRVSGMCAAHRSQGVCAISGAVRFCV
jgi:hypothetical protein